MKLKVHYRITHCPTHGYKGQTLLEGQGVWEYVSKEWHEDRNKASQDCFDNFKSITDPIKTDKIDFEYCLRSGVYTDENRVYALVTRTLLQSLLAHIDTMTRIARSAGEISGPRYGQVAVIPQHDLDRAASLMYQVSKQLDDDVPIEVQNKMFEERVVPTVTGQTTEG